MTDPCIHEKDFGELITSLKRIDKVVFGNGQPGLLKTVTSIETKVNTLIQTVDTHTNNVSKLLSDSTFNRGKESGIEREEGREVIAENLIAQTKRDKLQKYFWNVMAIIGMLGICTSVYFGVVNSQKPSTTSTELQTLKKENEQLKRTVNILIAPSRSGVSKTN
jgi:hypothetical protein